jgi:hypothetical protein
LVGDVVVVVVDVVVTDFVPFGTFEFAETGLVGLNVTRLTGSDDNNAATLELAVLL